MRPIQFCCQLFGRFNNEKDSTDDRLRSERALLYMLQALVEVNKLWLRKYPGTPPIYSGVVGGNPKIRYRREVDNEVWVDIPTLFRIGYSDCEDLGCARVAELSVKGIKSRPYISWRLLPNGGYLYHCRAWRETIDRELPPMTHSPITNRPVIIPDPSGVGYIEDPSLVLGMGWMPEAPKDANDLRAALIGRRLQHRGD